MNILIFQIFQIENNEKFLQLRPVVMSPNTYCPGLESLSL